MTKIDMSPGVVDYASNRTPDRYACGSCGARGVKLWRDYQTILDAQSLRCAACACRDEAANDAIYTVSQRENGRVHFKRVGDRYGSSDQIGWRVPAVPTAEGDTYWGYTSVPQDGCEWWYRLPIVVAREDG